MTAAAQRKLQKDIEVALKKVEDGIDEFDHVWDQATTCTNNSQKEKLGEELKKSINKLQRLRVQIREWIAQSDIKNNSKDKLEEARRRIENDMQRFKEFERDLKTKAFSACALAKEDELELEEAEKRKYQDWLTTTIQTLNEHLEEFEADLEVFQNKKSLSSDERDRQAQLKMSQERHQWHIKKLELILRALDNDVLDVTDLAIVRDSVEVYIDNQHDPEYPHDEALYDCFDLHQYEEAMQPRTPSMDVAPKDGGTPGGASGTSKEEPAKKSNKEKEKRKKEEKKEKKKEEKKAASTPQNASGGASNKSGGGNSSRHGGGDAKAVTPASGSSADARGEDKRAEDPALEEVKVQADQLLGGEAEEFVCKICQTHVVGCGPKLTNCSHLFCGDCLGQWFAQHPESQTWAQRAKAAGPDRVVPCPVCKQPLNEKKDLYPVCGATSRSENLLLWRMLSSLKIMCINHTRMGGSGRCEWLGEYGQYQKHIKTCGVQGDATPASGAPQALHGASPTTPRQGGTGESADKPAHGAPAATSAAAERERERLREAQAAQLREAQAAELREQAAAREAQAQQLREAQAAELRERAERAEREREAAAAAAREAARQREAQAAAEKAAAAQAAAAAAAAAESAKIAARQQQLEEPQPQAATGPLLLPMAEDQLAKPQVQPQQAPQDSAGVTTAKATSAFKPTAPNMVPCQVGDTIQILERHASGWTYCKNLSLGAQGVAGWAPAWIIQPVPDEAANLATTSPQAQRVKAPPADQVASGLPQQSAGLPPNGSLGPKIDVRTAEMHRTPQQAVAAAPTPQHAAMQAQAQPLRNSVANSETPTLAPKAPSTVVRVAGASFNASTPSQLTVAAGDLVEIVESHTSGWTYGRKVGVFDTQQQALDPMGPVEGWFPEWVCAQK